MPELPEVENVRRSLASRITGRQVVAVTLGEHHDVVRGDRSPTALLQGLTVASVTRHGKQLALVANTQSPATQYDAQPPRCVCVHLGMSGTLTWHPQPNARAVAAISPESQPAAKNHRHVVWQLDDRSTLVFRDPRRFGGVWTFATPDHLKRSRWQALGDDATAIGPATLYAQLARTTRGVKAALLDQNLIAGLGNIYVDELLFRARIHPMTPACSIDRPTVARLVGMMRRLLTAAIDAGGSTLRDYVDGNGDSGGFQLRHRVYGRAGLPCKRCRQPLASGQVAGRTTVWCDGCQPSDQLVDISAL